MPLNGSPTLENFPLAVVELWTLLARVASTVDR